jgi:hypothetical protein
VHPDSFTAQKKFLLNNLRRRYLLKVPDVKPAVPPADKPADLPTETAPTALPKPNRPAPSSNAPLPSSGNHRKKIEWL